MDWLYGLITNRIFISTAAAWFIAQVSKIIIEIIKGTFSKDRLTGSGGMPSSHSATVCALATSCGLTEGPHSGSFVVALFLAFIVMYDAMGVRYACGRNGKALNEINKRAKEKGEEPYFDKPMPEVMGHTLPEIIAGIIVGIVTAVIVCMIMPA